MKTRTIEEKKVLVQKVLELKPTLGMEAAMKKVGVSHGNFYNYRAQIKKAEGGMKVVTYDGSVKSATLKNPKVRNQVTGQMFMVVGSQIQITDLLRGLK